MKPRIETLTEKKLIGKRISMSIAHNKTFELWHSFMPLRKEIVNTIGTELYSIKVYKPGYFDNFNPNIEFEKWAAIEVDDFNLIHTEMKSITLTGGLYAVFDYKGSSADSSIFQYIFAEWLPKSEFKLDDRPHFEILGEKYKNNDLNSEEEIWIPIKLKM